MHYKDQSCPLYKWHQNNKNYLVKKESSFLVWQRAAQSMMDLPTATLFTLEFQFAGFRKVRSADKWRELTLTWWYVYCALVQCCHWWGKTVGGGIYVISFVFLYLRYIRNTKYSIVYLDKMNQFSMNICKYKCDCMIVR